ncbi:Glycosylinositol phosphorylceramide mannosyl transferase 1 [Linum grandiflorum]
MSSLNGIHDDVVDSPAKQKASNYTNRSAILLRRTPHLIAAAKFKLLLFLSLLCVSVFLTSRLSSFAGWIPDDNPPSSYTVLINTWKRSSPLKKSAAHYASCPGVDWIRVAWGETDPPSDRLKSDLERIVKSKGWKEFAFSVWRTAPRTMVGFVPRMHWLDLEKRGSVYHEYGGWLSVWWKGSYSMVLSKAAFFHKKYLDMYTNSMPSPMQDYLARERNCEDIALSIVIANASGTPPLWVQGKLLKLTSLPNSLCISNT